MKKFTLFTLLIILSGLAAYSTLHLEWFEYEQGPLANGETYEDEIINFEQQDESSFPEPNGIVFIGSSSIRRWHTLAEDMAPLEIIRRGFGGAHMSHVLHYFERVITPYQPKAVVVFVGGNDIGAGKSTKTLIADYEKFFSKLNTQLPDSDLWILGMKPSKRRWKLWQQMKEVNVALEKFADGNSKVNFVDMGNALLNSKGLPDEVYTSDGLHLNNEGYQRWTQRLKPLLLNAYLPSN